MTTAPSMRVLVTGGTGFTGSHLVRRLLQHGHQVVVLDTSEGLACGELENRGAKIHLGSVTDARLVDSLVEGCDVVYHLAAVFRQVNLPKEVYWNVNVNGTRYVLEAASRHAVKKVVHCSTCGVHGNVAQVPANEQAPIRTTDYYQLTKWESERIAHEYIRRGMDITILRPAAIYGPEDPERWVMLFRQVSKGTFFMFGRGTATYHPLYIDNMTDAFELAMTVEAARGQTYLIADDHYYTLKELVRQVAKVLDVDVKIIYLPFWPLWMAAVAAEAAYYPFKVSPPIFRRRVDWFRQYRAFHIQKARSELGYDPKVDLVTGLSRTAEWYRQNGHIEK